METFSQESIQRELLTLKDWRFIDNAIEKNYQFSNFVEAMGFIVQVGILAEKHNHHPELFNVYNKVRIRLNTHDAKGVTIKDINLAIAIDKIQ
jgi:4a-hydroxytetrahydrobiopterin dehydratase